MKRKWNTSRGESLTETLVALLISALALLLLSSAMGTAVNMIRSGKERMESYGEACSCLELRPTEDSAIVDGVTKKAGKIFTDGLGKDADSVTFYCNTVGKTAVIAYKEG